MDGGLWCKVTGLGDGGRDGETCAVVGFERMKVGILQRHVGEVRQVDEREYLKEILKKGEYFDGWQLVELWEHP